MYLSIHDNSALSLEEADDFTRFHISATPKMIATDCAAPAFQEIATDAGEGHYWLDADAIIQLSGRAADEEWTKAFWAMLEKAEPYGFSDIERRLIKAHLA